MLHRSYLSKDSSILITPLDDPESKIPQRFFPPMVINWSDRQVCYGPLLFAELETMIKEKKDAQLARLKAESTSSFLLLVGWTHVALLAPSFSRSDILLLTGLYDAELRRLRVSPIKRHKPEDEAVPLWEYAICAFIAAMGATYWSRNRSDKRNLGGWELR
jgi:hypothetical protein